MHDRPLQELTRELDAIIDSSSDGLFVCDGQGQILRVNPASARINNAPVERLEGRAYLEAAAEGLVILPSAALEAIKSRQQVSLLHTAYKRYGKQSLIARQLGMSQPTVARKLHRYGIGVFPEQESF